jgi:hypothetical protein
VKVAALALLPLALFLVAAPASADEALLVYVEDVQVAKGVSASGRALTPSLCSAVEKEAGLSSMCAPDVRQLVQAAGALAAVGGGLGGGNTAGLERRMGAVRFVAKPYLTRTKSGLKLLVRLFHKAEESQGHVVLPGRPAGRLVEEVSGTDVGKLLNRLGAMASRMDRMLHEPRNQGGKLPEPPAPLEHGGSAARDQTSN